MKTASKIVLCAMFLSFFCSGCGPIPTDVGRQPEGGSFEQQRRDQEELIKRQQEVIERQKRELEDLDRQKYYDEEYQKFHPRND